MNPTLTDDSRALLKAIFAGVTGKVWVANAGTWGGGPAATLVLDHSTGNYYSPSTMRMTATTRSNAEAERMCVLVADDVGARINPADLISYPPPSFIVRTTWKGAVLHTGQTAGENAALYDAAGIAQFHNEQWGWIIAGGANPAGYDDPTHYGRLPQGVNPRTGSATSLVDLDGTAYAEGDLAGLAVFLGLLKKAGRFQRGSVQNEKVKSFSSERIDALLGLVPNPPGLDFDSWINVLLWFKKCGGSFSAFDAWSFPHPNYKAAGVSHHWNADSSKFENITTPADVAFELIASMVPVDKMDDFSALAGGAAAEAFDDGSEPPAGGGGGAGGLPWGSVPPGLEDFVGHVPSGKMIHRATGEMVNPVSVNAVVSPPAPKVSASTWLLRQRGVIQVSWIPGAEKVVHGYRVDEAAGMVPDAKGAIWNQYNAPADLGGDAALAGPWVQHMKDVWGADADHILDWLAHRVQRPGEKINHALVLGGAQGIGKDIGLEPVVSAVGASNWKEAKPSDLTSNFCTFAQGVVVRINELKGDGDVSAYDFYQQVKGITTTPPATLRVNKKNVQDYQVPNVVGVIMTTNHRDALHIPDDDRRLYVAWSGLAAGHFGADYFTALGAWFEAGGRGHVQAFLKARSLAGFLPMAPPFQTKAWKDIVRASTTIEDEALKDLLDTLGRPSWVTLDDLKAAAEKAQDYETAAWLQGRYRRQHLKKLANEGYEPFDNQSIADGRWFVDGKQVRVYIRKGAAQGLVKQAVEARAKKP